jgi:indole-3-glycerol phosphate synthase
MLKEIIKVKKEEVEKIVLKEIELFKHYSLYEFLSNSNRDIGLIAEVKKASPSKGIIRPNFNPIEIAKSYVQEKTDAISVLTDQQFFQGSSDYLTEIKKITNVPILRKDFIIDTKQIRESKCIGADAILLIGEVLEPRQLKEFYLEAEELQLECLVEVHSIQTVENLLKEFTPKVIGINNRDLQSFTTSLKQTETIISYLPSESLIISESGIHTQDDLNFIKSVGARGVLVGEAFMREDNPSKGIKKLFGEDTVEQAIT